MDIEVFQIEVKNWLLSTFGKEIAYDKIERNHKFLEEALEVIQSLNCTRSEAHQLVDYVFDKPKGEPRYEIGGVMVTLAALCFPNSINLDLSAKQELSRIEKIKDKIREKHANKPKHSPLPE